MVKETEVAEHGKEKVQKNVLSITLGMKPLEKGQIEADFGLIC